jgi:hypothetical protein
MPDGNSGLIYVSAPSSAAGGYLWSFYLNGGREDFASDLTTIMVGTQSADAMFFTAAEPA